MRHKITRWFICCMIKNWVKTLILLRLLYACIIKRDFFNFFLMFWCLILSTKRELKMRVLIEILLKLISQKTFFSINFRTFFCLEPTNWNDVSNSNWSTKKHSTSSISSTKRDSFMKKQKSNERLTLIECFFWFFSTSFNWWCWCWDDRLRNCFEIDLLFEHFARFVIFILINFWARFLCFEQFYFFHFFDNRTWLTWFWTSLTRWVVQQQSVFFSELTACMIFVIFLFGLHCFLEKQKFQRSVINHESSRWKNCFSCWQCH